MFGLQNPQHLLHTLTVCCRVNTFSSASSSLTKAASRSEDNLAVSFCRNLLCSCKPNIQSMHSACDVTSIHNISMGSALFDRYSWNMVSYSATLKCCRHCSVYCGTTTQKLSMYMAPWTSMIGTTESQPTYKSLKAVGKAQSFFQGSLFLGVQLTHHTINLFGYCRYDCLINLPSFGVNH